MKYNLFIGSMIIYSVTVAQDTLNNKLQVSGYVKDMQSLNFGENLTNLTTGNLLHHRINFRWHPTKKITTALEIRNRLFWGEEVAAIPDFSRQIRNRNEALELSWNFLDEERMVFNTTIDRLWIQYEHEKWNVRIGRQRLNWGIGTTWNPNDLFNTYNFLDFDYEERPGVDGAKFQYFTSEMNYIEAAVSFSTRTDETVAAVKYFKNVAGYDLQFVAGMYRKQATLGVGWSGSIKETGFKGEIQYFLGNHEVDDQLNAGIEADHVFSKGWYLSVAEFVNSMGITKSDGILQVPGLEFSPKNLMPTRWNSAITVSKELSPLIAVTTTIIYSPNTNLLILFPAATYNITENMDVSLIWQSFFVDQQDAFDDLLHRCFLRFKWSY